MEETRKRQRQDTAVVAEKWERDTAGDSSVSGDLGEDIVAWLSVDEETVGELMRCLDSDSESAGWSTRVKFIENPYWSPLIFQSSSAYVTINGNEESCGSSFSDCESSVMASVDVSGILNVVGQLSGTRVGGEKGGARGVVDSCIGEWGEDCLARFLGDDDLVVGLTSALSERE